MKAACGESCKGGRECCRIQCRACAEHVFAVEWTIRGNVSRVDLTAGDVQGRHGLADNVIPQLAIVQPPVRDNIRDIAGSQLTTDLGWCYVLPIFLRSSRWFAANVGANCV